MKNYLILLFMSAIVFPAIGQDKVGILTTSPLGTLDIHRGTANEGTLVARGTNYPSHFNYSTAENTYIRGGKFGSHVLLSDQLQSGNVGIGFLTNPLQKLHVVGNTYITGQLGLGVAAPNGTLQFANTAINRKIVLWESINNDHQFYGLGINGNMMRYQVAGTNDSHAFFAGNAIPNSTELMRIKGDGAVAIGTPSPDNSALLQLNSTNRGLLIPRMNTQQRNAIVSPEPGLMILNLDDQCIDIFDGTNWIKNCGLKITGTDTMPAAWTTLSDFGGSPREGAIAFTIGTKGYIGTGYDGSYKNDFWEYDPATNIWTQKANASPTARTEAVGISLTGPSGQRGYMGTGKAAGDYLSDWWEYNPATNSWTQKMDFPGIPRSEAVGIAMVDSGYVGTGKDNSNFFSDIWTYSALSNNWSSFADYPYVTHGAVGYAVDENFLYIGSGWKQGSPNYTTNSFYSYNFQYEGWGPENDFIGEDRHSAVAFVVNGEAYVGLGKTDNNVLKNDIWKYVPLSGDDPAWIQQSNFPSTARANAVAFTINNKVYIGTGNDGGYKNDFRNYEPYPQGNVYSTPALPQPLFSESDGIWTRANTVVHPSSLNTSMIGIGLSNAVNRLDIHTGTARTGNHPTGRSLYVTGPLSANADGIEFRHSNGTQGIGFGYNTIYATGSDGNQGLGIASRGTGNLNFLTNGVERIRINGDGGNVGIGIYSSDANLAISRGLGGEGTLSIYGTAYNSHFNNGETEHTYIRGGKTGAHVFINDIANLGNVGIGTITPVQKLHVDGSAYITNKVGIAMNTPNAPLQFSNVQENRKIVLYEAANNNHQFFGFGTGGGELRYQVNSPADHVFYKGTASGSTEQMRIRDNGNVDVSGTVEMGWERKTITAQIPAGLTTALTCNCTSPRKVIGGGASADLDGAVLTESYPSTDSQWQVVYKNEAAFPINITVYAICARIGD